MKKIIKKHISPHPQGKLNPIVISVKTLIDTPTPKHFVAKTIKVKQLATNKGK